MERRLPLLGQRLGQIVSFSGGGQSTRVSPGDLITADLVNSILDRLDSAESKLTALEAMTGFTLGSLGTGVHTLVALSTGFESPVSSIWLDGNQILVGSRGINLVILDSQSLTVKYISTYDTHASIDEANRLVSDLQQRTNHYDVVVVATQDAYTNSLTNAAADALAAVGGKSLSDPFLLQQPSRANGAFIGVVPGNLAGSIGNLGFDYLVSVIPADTIGFDVGRLAALPFVWGLYSIPQQRFLLGGAANNSDTTGFPPTSLGVPLIASRPGVTGRPSLINFLRGARAGDPVHQIPGISNAEAQLLQNNGITNVGELAKADPARVATILNIQPNEAQRVIGIVRELLGPGQ